jgi:hypothetical protein
LLEPLPPSRLCAADTTYDSDALRDFLITRGTEQVIPNKPTRKRIKPFDQFDPLPPKKYHRACLLPPQGLEACRHMIRQAHAQFRGNLLHHRSSRNMVAQLSQEPRALHAIRPELRLSSP